MTRLLRLLPLAALIAGCAEGPTGPVASEHVIADPVAARAAAAAAPRSPAAWTTRSLPFTAAEGLVEIHFTRPGVDAATGEDPEVDDALASFIYAAQESVELALFEFDRPTLVDAVLAAHELGVQIRFAGDADEIHDAGYEQLLAAGLELTLRKPNDRIMHNKFVVIDGRWVATGSMNFSQNGVLRNNNNVVIVDSPELATYYRAEFDQMNLEARFGTQKDPLADKTPLAIGGRQVEAYFSPKDVVSDVVLDALATAESGVYFMVFSFTHPAIAAELEALHAAGVEVVGVFDESQARGRYSVDEQLAKAGLPVHIDGNDNAIGWAGGKLHHKVMIIDPGGDDPIVITGSYNWSNSATKYNDENILVLRGPDLVAPFVEEFCEVLEVAVPHPDFAGQSVDPCANLLTPVRINEILANPAGTDGPNEFVELVNTGAAPVDLTGWTLGDALDPARHVFGGVTLAPGAAVVVWSGPDPAEPTRVVASSGALSLNNNADEVRLHDAAGTLIDRVAYQAASSDVSFNRDPDGAPAGGFVLHDGLAPGGLPSSPGAMVDGAAWPVATPSEAVILNEVFANPPGTDGGQEYVELVNVDDQPVALAGWTLEDAVSVRHVFADATALLPGQAIVLFDKGDHADVPGALLASSGGLSLNNTGDTLILRNAAGEVVDAVTWGTAPDGASLNREVDGSFDAALAPHDALAPDGAPTSPGARLDGTPWFVTPAPGTVFMNELLANPSGTDGGQEYVEIVNANPGPVDLSAWVLADLLQDRHVFADGAWLPAGGALVLFDSGDHAGVPNVVMSSTGSLSLNNTSETMTLRDASGATMDEVSWTSVPDGSSLNREEDGAPGGALVDHTTVAPGGEATSPGTKADGSAW